MTAAAFAVFSFVLLSGGCASVDQSEALIKQVETMDLDYLLGDHQRARSILTEEIALLENSRVVQPRRQAAALFMACGRLCVLEKRLGASVASELAFVKVRYWNLRRYELAGEITEQALAEYMSLTPERLTEIIDRADKAINHGRGPKYIEVR
jgi:hypothetical protein